MVSRLVDQARNVGLVRETIECELTESEQQRLHDEVYRGKELLSKLKDVAYDSGVGSLTQLQIVPTGLGIKSDESWDQAVAVFGDKAAPYCLTLLGARRPSIVRESCGTSASTTIIRGPVVFEPVRECPNVSQGEARQLLGTHSNMRGSSGGGS